MRRKFEAKANVAVIATLGVLATVGVGYAAIPAADGKIKACYATSSSVLLGIPYSKGDTRIIDSAEGCRSYERPIAWSQAGLKGDPGPAGSPGTLGPQGPAGPVGPAGSLSGYEVAGNSMDVPPQSFTPLVVARCPTGKKVLGGGFETTQPDGPLPSERVYMDILGSRPTADGWSVRASNPNRFATLSLSVYAICADAAA